MANMAIGPIFPIAGNDIQMTRNGKFQITNAEGKVKTLSQNQFKKQLIKNADKIAAGENVEFKSSKKGLFAAIAAGVVLASAAALGIASHKKILKELPIAKDDVILKKAAKKVNNFAEFLGRNIVEYSSKAFKAASDFVAKYTPKALQKTEEAA